MSFVGAPEHPIFAALRANEVACDEVNALKLRLSEVEAELRVMRLRHTHALATWKTSLMRLQKIVDEVPPDELNAILTSPQQTAGLFDD